MVIVIAGAFGFSLTQDATVEDNINDGASGIVDEVNDNINIMGASSDGEAALAYAREKLDVSHYSESQLREELVNEYGEVYTEDAADYALNNIDADWNAEALEAAESYIRHSHYSYDGSFTSSARHPAMITPRSKHATPPITWKLIGTPRLSRQRIPTGQIRILT